MESSIVHKKTGKKYFNTQNIDPNNPNNVSTQNTRTEKLSLTFSLINCTTNAVYHLNANFIDDKEIFKTEKKKTTGKLITFNSRYIVNYFFEKEQNLKIEIFKAILSHKTKQNKPKAGSITLPDLKLYYKAIVNKAA